MTFLSAIVELKRERERRGLTLAEVSARSGLETGMLSRLENGKLTNPTLPTLWCYAPAIGSRLSIAVEAGAVKSEEARI
jgi:transcriptional regulator with XRE-family HTH domain